MKEYVIVYIDGLPMCRQPAWGAETILAAREAGVCLSCSHMPDDANKLVDFLRSRGHNAYVRSGDDCGALCEPMPYWDENGNEEWPEFDYEARWYPEE